jgi:hypothetical protein
VHPFHQDHSTAARAAVDPCSQEDLATDCHLGNKEQILHGWEAYMVIRIR